MHNLANIWQFCKMEENCYYTWEKGLKYDYALALIILENNNSQSVFLPSSVYIFKLYK